MTVPSAFQQELSSQGPAASMIRRAKRVFALVRDPGGDDRALYKTLVDSLFASPASIVLGSLAAVIASFLCWRATGLDVFLQLTWLTIAIVVLRMGTIVRYRLSNPKNHTYDETRAWDREYFAGATMLSLVLGSTCYIALAWTTNVAAHITMAVVIIAFSSGYVARNAGRPTFVIIQLIVFCVPLAAGLLEADDPSYHAIGYYAILYIVSNVAITLSIHRNLIALSNATRRSETLAEELRERNITLDAALNNMTHGLAMLDERMAIAVANSRFGELYALPDRLVAKGTALSDVLDHLVRKGMIRAGSAEALVRASHDVLENGRTRSIEAVTQAGRTLVISIAVVPDGGLVLLTEDATERKATEAKIERMARFDGLTGLANRFALNAALDEAAALRATRNMPYSVLYVDLDSFKDINDGLGHDTGDQVLVETARRLAATVGPNHVVARFGGDEFVVLARGATLESATALAGRIIEAMAPPVEVSGGKLLHVSASVGLASSPDHGLIPGDVLRHADIALYEAKAVGKGGVMAFSPAMAEALLDRHQLGADLRNAVEANELELHYQPIVDTTTRKIMGYEALMRWKHVTRGYVSPVVFIPIAEQTGLIQELGEWALKEAARAAARLPGRTTVAVNVSPQQFRHPDRLVAAVRDALHSSGLEPQRLSLEVTESLLIEDRETTLGVIRDLRALGVRFSLDDFGTGYSSLAYLSTYPFSQVKIDRSFARDVVSNTTSRSIIEAVCQLAGRLGMQVVVEGIETEDQLAIIRALGAGRAQGWLFGKPMPLHQILEATAA